MKQERRLSASSASPGRASAELAVWRVCNVADQRRDAGEVGDELALFGKAADDACKQLEDLASRVSEDAAEILEFQIELLEEFREETCELLEQGLGCDVAWSRVLDREIASYQESGEAFLESRGSDLIDLKLRVLRGVFGVEEPGLPQGTDKPVVIVAPDLSPSEFLQLDREMVAGLALREGSPTSHVALLAKARGTPMVVGLSGETTLLEDGAQVLLDADNGLVIANPTSESLSTFGKETRALARKRFVAEQRVSEPAVTRDGEAVQIHANIDDVSLLCEIDADRFDGIGLVRTEFLFSDNHAPDEEEQFQIYSRLVEWAGGKPITIRTLDAGGDKPIKGISVPAEANPFLGLRGYRLSRTVPEMFGEQLRALARVAAKGNIKVMIPMVTEPDEMEEFRQLFADTVLELMSRDIECATPALGMMVEVPAAALCVCQFDADFCSIGSNDLVQYATAAARDNPQVSALANSAHPGLLNLIRIATHSADLVSMPISVCGDMASNEAGVHSLLKVGIRSLSVAPAQVSLVKEAVREWSSSE